MLLLQCTNLDEMFETFQNKFLSIIDNNAPITTLSRKESKLRQKPWIAKSILEYIRIKNQLYKKYIRKKDDFWFERCKFYRNKVNMLISKSKRNYVGKYFQEVEGNSKRTWTNISNKKCTAKNDIFLSENSQIITNYSLVANTFPKYFVNAS